MTRCKQNDGISSFVIGVMQLCLGFAYDLLCLGLRPTTFVVSYKPQP